MNEFIIYPAIDLRSGKVVRLKEGDPFRQTQYGDDPSTAAKRWLDAGARWLHVVNLDGAFGEKAVENQKAVEEILFTASQYQVPIQFGGGLRNPKSIEIALNSGINRVIVGTLAIEQPEEVKKLILRWGVERIGVGLDSREGRVAIRGWQRISQLTDLEMANYLASQGLRWLVYTDISRDGMQTGLNIDRTARIAEESGLCVIASGGVAGWDDISSARNAHLGGVIIGRALYEGVFDPVELFKDLTTC